MNRTYINEVQKEIGNTVKVQGFIENLRNSKYMAFIVLKDITGKLQITVEKEDHPDLVGTIDQLTPDSVITVTGKVVENDYVKIDRKSTRLNSSHMPKSRMPSSA